MISNTPKSSPESQPSPTPDPLAPYNVLLLGYGGPGHDGGEITDSIMVLHVRPRDKHLITISVPRDLWVPLRLDQEDQVYKKINHAYALGNDLEQYSNRPVEYQGINAGLKLAKDTLELITGLPIKNTLAINFSVFEQSIDKLGGVDVDVPMTFTDEFYPLKGEEENPCGKTEEEIEALTATLSGYLLEQQFPCRYEKLEFKAGEIHMDGKTALKFVRSRHSNTAGNDFNRSLRQQALIKALRKKATSFEGIMNLIPTLKVVFQNINTDLDFASVTEFLTTQGLPKEYEVSSVIISTDNVLMESRSDDRQYILIPQNGSQNWKIIHEFINQSIASVSGQKNK